MNYFAHGRPYTDQPYFLAGTATPDWLCVVDRRVRTRAKTAAGLADDADPRLAALARGIVRHHQDDAWFHATRAFAELSLQFTAWTRRLLAESAGLRAGFLGHILVELLLDAELIGEDPPLLDAYYRALDAVDPAVVQRGVERIAGQPCQLLALFIPRFSAERFLYDYADDGRLLKRLNRVMQRVRLESLPDELAEILPAARLAVRQRKAELLDRNGFDWTP